MNVKYFKQQPDGCVTASSLSFLPDLTDKSSSELLGLLRKYSLDENNVYNNHMLGVAVIANELGLEVYIHKKEPLKGDILPDNASEQAKIVHPKVIEKIYNSEITLSEGFLSFRNFKELLKSKLDNETGCLVLLNWPKWDPSSQKNYGNPRHIINVYGYENNHVFCIDTAKTEDENPVESSFAHVYYSLDEKQQLIFISK